MAESLEGWAAHRRPRPGEGHRAPEDRSRALVLILAVVLFAAVLTVAAVMLHLVPDASAGNLEQSNRISNCYLLYPDDTAAAEECANQGP